MKKFPFLIILSHAFNFGFSIAQVDSTLKDNPLIVGTPSPLYDLYQRDISIQFDQENLFRINKSIKQETNIFLNDYIQTFFFNDFRVLSEKSNNNSIDFSRMIPQSNPVFSISYALFNGLYSDKKYFLKRWDCIK